MFQLFIFFYFKYFGIVMLQLVQFNMTLYVHYVHLNNLKNPTKFSKKRKPQLSMNNILHQKYSMTGTTYHKRIISSFSYLCVTE